jgi:hypothetical protein
MVDHMSRQPADNRDSRELAEIDPFSAVPEDADVNNYHPRTGCGSVYGSIDESRALLESSEILSDTNLSELDGNAAYTKYLEELWLYGTWTSPVNLFINDIGTHKRCGVYAIFHVDEGLCYIGHSKRLGGRRYTHSKFFRNGGKTYVSPSGSAAGSAVSKKMFKRDPDEGSWMYSYINIDSPRFSRAYEKRLIETLDPVFNARGWAGI